MLCAVMRQCVSHTPLTRTMRYSRHLTLCIAETSRLCSRRQTVMKWRIPTHNSVSINDRECFRS